MIIFWSCAYIISTFLNINGILILRFLIKTMEKAWEEKIILPYISDLFGVFFYEEEPIKQKFFSLGNSYLNKKVTKIFFIISVIISIIAGSILKSFSPLYFYTSIVFCLLNIIYYFWAKHDQWIFY